MFNNKNPLALPALALIAGIFAGSGLEIGSSVILWISITLLFIVVLLFIFAKGKSLSQKFIFIIISFFIIGFLKIGADTNREVSVINDNNYLSEEEVVVSGVALENPAIKKKRMTFIANLDSIYVQRKIFPINEKAIVNVRIDSNETTIKKIKYGDKIFAVGKFLKPRDLRNPGEFNYAEYLKLQDINVFFNVKSAKCIIAASGGNGNYIQQSIIQPLRQYIGESVDEIFTGSESSFLKGLLIGDRSELTKDVKESFLNAGVMHVLAVSGLNVAFVIIIFSGLYSIFVPLRQLRTVLIIISLLIYMMVSGSSPSIVRATIMGIVFITGAGIERKTSAMNMLAVSAIIILLIDSRELFDLGFQLSFLCVFALIYFYPVLSALVGNYGLNKPLRWLLNSILGSIAVLIMLFPVLASAAGKVSIISIIANLFVVPLANLSLALGFMQIIFGVISTSLMQTISEANRLFLFLNLSITGFFGSLKYSYIEIYFTKYSTAIYYLCVFAAFYFIRQKKYNILLIFSVLLITIFSWSAILGSGGDKLKIVFFDVGQGDACLITTINGKNILIDSGPAKDDYDAGEKVIYPYLVREGIKNIDLCFISHFHDDHYGGLPYLIKKKMVKNVYYQDKIGSNKIFSGLDRFNKQNFPV